MKKREEQLLNLHTLQWRWRPISEFGCLLAMSFQATGYELSNPENSVVSSKNGTNWYFAKLSVRTRIGSESSEISRVDQFLSKFFEV